MALGILRRYFIAVGHQADRFCQSGSWSNQLKLYMMLVTDNCIGKRNNDWKAFINIFFSTSFPS